MTFVQKPICAVPNNTALSKLININNSTGLKRKRHYPHNSTINITENQQYSLTYLCTDRNHPVLWLFSYELENAYLNTLSNMKK